VVSEGKSYTVVEGNTRIAAYKLLTGLATPSLDHKALVPAISTQLKESLSEVECAVAPDRESLLPIMASAHFGLGDKSKWGYLGSRKAVYDQWLKDHTVAQLAKIFNQPKGKIRDYILEYKLFLQSLEYEWPDEEREKLEDPAVKFNPPVRFLQGQNHKVRVGVELDRDTLQIKFTAPDAQEKLQHVIRKLVTKPEKGPISVTNLDAVQYLQKNVGPHDLTYLDPPYYVRGQRLYKNFYGHEDHRQISRCVRELKGHWVVSYDDVAPIRLLYGWATPLPLTLRYTAGNSALGREVVFVSPSLHVGATELRVA
jgi:hypothetical protein